MSPTTKTSGWPGSVRSGLTPMRPARSSGAPVCSARVLPSGLACTPAAQILVTVLMRSTRPSLNFISMPRSSTSVTIAPRITSTPSFSSSALALRAELLAERRQHLGGGVEQDHAGLAGVDRPEVALERAVRELGDLAGHLHAGRAGAHDHEGQQVVDVVAAVGAELGHLEGAEDAAAQLEGVVDALHARGVLGEVVVAEVGLRGAGGDDEGVVLRDGLAAEHVAGDRARLEVDVGDLAEQHLRVLLAAEDLAGGGRDLALGEDAGGHLVEQRLEEVVGRLGDHRDVDGGLAQCLGAEETTEAGADHDHLVGGLLLGLGIRHVIPPGAVRGAGRRRRPRHCPASGDTVPKCRSGSVRHILGNSCVPRETQAAADLLDDSFLGLSCLVDDSTGYASPAGLPTSSPGEMT